MANLQPGGRVTSVPKSGGSFGKKAAIKWKALKQEWRFIVSMAIGALIIMDLMQKNSGLDQKLLVLESGLQQLKEEAIKTTNLLNHLLDSMEGKLDRSEFEKSLPQNEQEGGQLIQPIRKDFASFPAGASVIEQLTSPTWSYRRKIPPSRLPFFENHVEKISGSAPTTVLLSDLTVGTCWSFHGTTGQIAIRLSRPILVEGITIGHISQNLAYDIQTAPARFELWGLNGGSLSSKGQLLLENTYSIDSSENVQYFAVTERTLRIFSAVVVKIKSNHGNPDFTCLYRVQVHGKMETTAEELDKAGFPPT